MLANGDMYEVCFFVLQPASAVVEHGEQGTV